MMERLTARSPKNNMAYLVNVKPNEQVIESSYPNTLRCITEAFDRLAKYEDLKLMPDEIKLFLVDFGISQAMKIRELKAELTRATETLNDICNNCGYEAGLKECSECRIEDWRKSESSAKMHDTGNQKEDE